MRARLAALAVVVSLAGCSESPQAGWRVVPPNHIPRPSCDQRGGFAVRGADGALQITTDPAGLVGASLEFDAALPYRDGWLLTRIGCEGELCPNTDMRVVQRDGRVDVLESSPRYDAVASTADGLYLLDKSCTFHRMFLAETSLYRAIDLQQEPAKVGGRWPYLCARAMAVDESGSIWLLGSIYPGYDDPLENVILRVVDGQPRVVHHVRDAYDPVDVR
ncbi:MAG TPA: hypothetical protein VK034_06100, partial [Enhygromyxa sp.]|nr:hypothetical protein [Enhygromyxa sp.]